MNKLGFLAVAAQFLPRLFQIRRGTWFALGAGLMVLMALLTWALFSLGAWLFGQSQNWMQLARQGMAAPAQDVLSQVEQAAPGVVGAVTGAVGDYLPALPALKPETPARDVSGQDLGPVPRYPGLVRSAWQGEGARLAVEFSGGADYPAVLDHYVRGFAQAGFAQTVLSASPEAERHEYVRGGERIQLLVSRDGRSAVRVRLETGRGA